MLFDRREFLAGTAEVNKMKAVYGASVATENIPAIVDYLGTQNGKDRSEDAL